MEVRVSTSIQLIAFGTTNYKHAQLVLGWLTSEAIFVAQKRWINACMKIELGRRTELYPQILVDSGDITPFRMTRVTPHGVTSPE